MQVRERQRTDFIHGKIKNVGHARVSLRQCSVLLSYAGTACGTLSDVLASIHDDKHSIESADLLQRDRAALRVA